MDRGDSSFVMHDSFKDLKTRRAEQEAYRKALEEQIVQRKKLQELEREREKCETRKMYQHNARRSEDMEQRRGLIEGNYVPSPPASFRNLQSSPPQKPRTPISQHTQYSPRVQVNSASKPGHVSPRAQGSPSPQQSQLSPRSHDTPVPQQGYISPRAQGSPVPHRGYISPRAQGSPVPHQGYISPRMQESPVTQQGYISPRTQGSPVLQQGYLSPRMQGSPIPQQGYTSPRAQGSPIPQQTHLSPRAQGFAIQHSPPLSPRIQGQASILQRVNEANSVYEPHPVVFAANPMQNYNVPLVVGNIAPCVPGSPRVIPAAAECMQYIQPVPVVSGYAMPSPRTLLPEGHLPMPLSPHCNPTVAALSPRGMMEMQAVSSPYNNQAFSSGTTSESSSFEDVRSARHAPMAKIHVSQTSEQIHDQDGVKVSRTLYRLELQQQIEEKRRREKEFRRREEEAEERIQEKIRIDQHKMQIEYEDELRKQEEKEVEAEMKRLAALGKQSEIVRAEEKMKAKQRRHRNQPPSQREISSRRISNVELLTRVDAGENAENLDSICEFFDTTMPRQNSEMPPENYLNPDDRIIPAVANRLREEAFRKQLEVENSQMDLTVVDTPRSGKSIPASGGHSRRATNKSKSTDCNNNAHNTSNGEVGKFAGGGSLTARVPLKFQESFDNEMIPSPRHSDMPRGLAVRSAPCLTDGAGDTSGQEFLSSLKTYLEDEKTKLLERMQMQNDRKSMTEKDYN